MAIAKWPPRVALITGAASGLGRQMALQLAAQGAAIAALDVNGVGLHDLEREITAQGGKISCEAADVTDSDAVDHAAKALEAILGPVDLLIASAGIGYETSAVAINVRSYNAIINVNLIGVANSIAAVLPGMLARRAGHIVAISSLASYQGLPLMGAYCASKAGVNAAVESIRLEVGSRGIDTTVVCPGWIKTPLTDRINLQASLMLDAEYAARRIIDGIRKRRRFLAFPWTSRGPLVLLQFMPRAVADWVLRRMLRSATAKRQTTPEVRGEGS